MQDTPRQMGAPPGTGARGTLTSTVALVILLCCGLSTGCFSADQRERDDDALLGSGQTGSTDNDGILDTSDLTDSMSDNLENHRNAAVRLCNADIALVINHEVYDGLKQSIVEYLEDLDDEGRSAVVDVWTEGTVEDLRDLLEHKHQQCGIDGAWLIGELPTAWYEQEAFDKHEEFPMDLYLMDFEANWGDRDENDKLDAHTDLDLDIYVSRLQGTAEEIENYFDKIHDYRTAGSLVQQTAFIFKDDDWSDYHAGERWDLDSIYGNIYAIESTSDTTVDNYIDRLTGQGAEYVYQWIHSYPRTLIFKGEGSGILSTTDISTHNFKGSFYNLFDCSASRFTQENLAMAYLTDTDYGLATIGSTKTGGNFDPQVFHSALGEGETWGDAYRKWYNETGKDRDEWYLGIVILGDPMLSPRNQGQGFNPRSGTLAQVQAWTEEEIARLGQTMATLAEDVPLSTFDDYRRANPLFFRQPPK